MQGTLCALGGENIETQKFIHDYLFDFYTKQKKSIRILIIVSSAKTIRCHNLRKFFEHYNQNQEGKSKIEPTFITAFDLKRSIKHQKSLKNGLDIFFENYNVLYFYCEEEKKMKTFEALFTSNQLLKLLEKGIHFIGLGYSSKLLGAKYFHLFPFQINIRALEYYSMKEWDFSNNSKEYQGAMDIPGGQALFYSNNQYIQLSENEFSPLYYFEYSNIPLSHIRMTEFRSIKHS